MTHRDFIADLQRTDVPVPRATLTTVRAVLSTTPLARWEIAEQRTALVDSIDYLLAKDT